MRPLACAFVMALAMSVVVAEMSQVRDDYHAGKINWRALVRSVVALLAGIWFQLMPEF